jgi:hypothetical protein
MTLSNATSHEAFDPDTTFAVSQRALIQKLDDETVILDAENGQYYTLNSMATQIMDRVNQGESVAQIVAHLHAQYDVASDELAQDVQEVLAYLTQKALIEQRQATV